MAYKLLIVDDEYIVRMGMRDTIDWHAIDIEVVGEAANGKQGLMMAKELKPDIIITDVRMPVMDGIDMARTLFDAGADLSVVIYSGYRDFDYVRRALESDVAGYLLKPIDNNELVKKVLEVLSKLKSKREARAKIGVFENSSDYLRTQIFLRWLGGENDPEFLKRLSVVNIRPYDMGRIIYGAASEANVGAIDGLLRALDASLAPAAAQSLVMTKDFLCVTSALDERRIANIASDVLAKQTGDVRFRLVVSDKFCDAKSRGEVYRAVLERVKNLPYSHISSVHLMSEQYVKLKKLSRDVLAIIERDYMKKLSVKSVADELYVSESHLMHELKENLGKTFNVLLTEYRISKAKELLLEGKYRINEVALMVGYSDVKYFGQVFKEITGMTAGEFISSAN